MHNKYVQALAVSDTHGNRRALNAIVRSYPDIPYLFHLGDNVRDAEYLADRLRETCVLNVKGNCDPGSPDPVYEDIVIKGQRIILTHGHTLQVKYGLERLAYYADEHNANAILFGHTHIAAVERVGGIWLINPGSAGAARGRVDTVAMLLIGENGIIPRVLPLDLD